MVFFLIFLSLSFQAHIDYHHCDTVAVSVWGASAWATPSPCQASMGHTAVGERGGRSATMVSNHGANERWRRMKKKITLDIER